MGRGDIISVILFYSKAWPGACGVILSSDAGAAELLLCHAAKVDALNQQAKSIILFLSSIKSNINYIPCSSVNKDVVTTLLTTK